MWLAGWAVDDGGVSGWIDRVRAGGALVVPADILCGLARDEYAFVCPCHVEPDVPMERQTKQALHWTTVEAGRSKAHGSGKVVVCGHTSQESGLPLDLGHTICLDTLGGGWLTCLDVELRRGWQVKRGGRDRREFEL